MIVIRLRNLRLAITHVGNFKSGGLQAIDNSGGTQSSGRALVTRGERGSAGGSADNGNLSCLPDNLYSQRNLLMKNVGPRENCEGEKRCAYGWFRCNTAPRLRNRGIRPSIPPQSRNCGTVILAKLTASSARCDS